MKNNKFFICFIVVICIAVIITCKTISNIFSKKINNNSNEETSSVVVNDTGTKIVKVSNEDYISYEVEDKDSNLNYEWVFKNTEGIDTEIDNKLNLKLTINAITNITEKINKLVSEDKLIITFDHHGELPEKANIRLNVEDKFNNNDSLYLYYYNPETDEIEFIDKNIIVQDGYVEFTIDHCSDYFLTGAVVNNINENPKALNYVIIILGTIAFILVGVTLIKSRGK